MQGKYIEVGINITGAYGSSTSAPSGYHPRPNGGGSLRNTCTGTCSDGTTGLGFVADPDKDGWTVGSPAYYGDYFLPGVPQEGWSIEANGHQSNAWNFTSGCGVTDLYTGSLGGTNLSYNASGSTRSGTWQGTNGDGLTITQVTSLDTNNLFFTVKVTVKNSSTSTVNNIYYIRTVDPDNDQTLPGGGFVTINKVEYQLPNPLGATLVSAQGTAYASAWLGLGTLDCRAKCFYVVGGSTFIPGASNDSAYNQLPGTSGMTYTGTATSDDLIGLVFKIGNIAPGDSTTFSYAYVLKASDLLDALSTTATAYSVSDDTSSVRVSNDTATACIGDVTTVTIQNPGTATWTWHSITGETLSTYTGTSTQVAMGTTIIKLFAVAPGVGCAGANDTIYVNIKPRPIPAAPTPGSNSPVCAGSALNLTATTVAGVTYEWSGPAGFTSTLQNPSITGVTTGMAGNYLLSAVLNGCSSDTNFTAVTVATISPVSPSSASICPGATVSLSDGSSGGSWSSSSSGVASVSSSGVVLGNATGVTTINYTQGVCVASALITVNSAPAPISPSTATVCLGGTTVLTDASGGGTWSSGSTNASVTGGTVSGLATGTATISYTQGTCSSLAAVTVVAAPAAISPASASVCVGSTILLTDATGSGTWSASNTHASVSGGTVTGLTVGVDTISYALGTCVSKAVVTVNATPAPISPASATICLGSTTTLTETTTGGTWSAQNTNASVTGGTVTGLVAGIDIISYTVGSCSATSSITIVTAPAAISPASGSVCIGSTVVYSDPTGSGTWSAQNSNATVTGGNVTGVAAGTDVLTYTIGSCFVTATVTVNSLPAAITPAGAVSICAGATATLGDTSPGGTWSSGAAGVATVSGGIVTGVSAGSAAISYTNSFGCSAVKIVTVNITPAALAPSSANICVGNTVTLTETVAGGTWSSSAPLFASVVGGVVTGVAPGTATITYTIGSCAVSATVTVSAIPGAGTITGPSTICVGGTGSYSDGSPGGTWSSATIGVATISSGGSLLGISGGTTVISYSISGVCGIVAATKTVTVVPAGVNPIVGAALVCAGSTTTFTDATTGGTWSSSNATATVNSAGLVTGITPGTDTITYSVTNVCGTSSTTKVITVGPFLSAGTITGTVSAACVGGTLTLADLAPGGVWSASNGHATVSGGVVTGVSAGVDTIMYSVSSGCGSAMATHVVTINALPSAGTITGPSAICAGSLIVYTDTTSGGVWNITNSHATISISGVVNPLTAGTDTITYKVTTTCGIATATKVITIGAFLTAGTITGPASVCTGSTINLLDGATGGVWSASNGHATISALGVVTGVTAGIDTISYTVTSSCGSAVAVQLVTVNLTPSTGSISGPSAVCLGTPATYTVGGTGGVWSVSNGSATISGAGLVTPVSLGVDTISYTITSVCGSVVATKIITVAGSVTAGAISGPVNVCIGSSIILGDTAPGGAWSASNGHATVTGGIVNGISTGMDTISYTVTGSCGSAVATSVINVSPVPSGGTITGPSALCTGGFTIYTDASASGVWSVSNASVTITPGGLVTAMSVGTDTITYTVTNGCGTASATKVVTIGTSAPVGPISGPTAVCVGSSITLTEGTTGGVWSASNGHALVSGGTVTGASAGTDTILYTVTSGCGAVSAAYSVTISSFTPTGVITGPSGVCAGSTITLADAVTGGTWSSSNANASVSSSGVVTGRTMGVDTIIYTTTGICGAASTMAVISIDGLLSAGTISATGSTVCPGSSVSLSDATPGGVWSAANTDATVTSSGTVTGVIAGVDVISYTVSNACGPVAATMAVTINPSPDAGTISGPDSVCLGSSVSLSDPMPGGTWSAGNTDASVSVTGVVTGITAGTDPISYTVTNSCGTASTSAIVTITPLATAGTISGIGNVCAGSGITLTDGAAGGTWAASNTNAMVTGPGIVVGTTVGIDTILYVVSTSCGSSTTFKVITINPVPVVAAISGPTSQCTGSSITLTDPTTGGIWTSSTPSIATIGLSTGVVTGVSAGATTVTYTVTNSFGCPASVTALDTVSVSGAAPAITGATGICVGGSETLSDAASGGTWSSSAPSIATVGAATGVVSGLSAGAVTISYMVMSSCGTSVITTTETVNPLPVIAAISGAASECAGTVAILTNATPGGEWSSANTAIATVGSGTGVVSGVAAGTVDISYTVTSAAGCSATVAITDTVTAAPSVAAITGVAHQCLGSTSTLSDITPGGVWTSSNTAIASVSGGIVTGAATGIAVISYTVSGGGCTATAVVADTVNTIPLPTPITGPTTICTSGTSTLANATTGGVWSSGNTAVATIDASGIVTPVSVGSAAIYYSISNSCGSVVDTAIVTVQVTATAGTISGASSVCPGASVTLTDGISGGIWSATNGRATVGSASGIVTAVAAGVDTIRYTVTSACGTATTQHIVTVGSLPYAGVISGFTSVCAGSSASLTESVTGGTWSSSNSSVATVSGGTVSGIAPGSATISYSVTNGCGTRSATHSVTVVPSTICHTLVNNVGNGSTMDIKVYPNPATSVLQIDAPVKVNISILTADGKVVMTASGATSVDVSQLADAVYMIMIRDEAGQLLKTAKFAKVQ